MFYRLMKRILPLYAKIQLSLRQILISILKMKAGVRTYECNFALGTFFLEGHFDLKMVVDLRVRSENGN